VALTEQLKEEILIGLEPFLEQFESEPTFQSALKYAGQSQQLQLKGLVGSLDAVAAAVFFRKYAVTQLFVLHDYEEASYFRNDLQQLLPQAEVLLFPSSYKKPYQFVEVENANVLMRSEVLNMLNSKQSPAHLIVTYPDALTEKVINKRTLLQNTFSASVGERLDVGFLSELLMQYDFQKVDFVYEAGQFAIRGGILDVFSYANELPYRLELFGDEVESIRTFDPLTQLSSDAKQQAIIIPNVQNKMLQEVRESFLHFVDDKATIWFKDYEATEDTIHGYFRSAEENFEQILKASGNTQVVKSPEDLFESVESFRESTAAYRKIEFGNRFALQKAQAVQFGSKPQPPFHKNFNLLVENLDENEASGYRNIITSGASRQLERIRTIFDEIDPNMVFHGLNISLRAGFISVDAKVACYTEHQIFERYYGVQAKKKFSSAKALTLKELRELKIGDYVTHADYGVGRFGGMEKVEANGRQQEAIRLIYRDNDLLYVSLHSLHKISKYSGKEGHIPQVSKLGSVEWENKKKRVKKRVKDIAKDLINLYAKRKAALGFKFSQDNYLQAELESSFIYEDTPDQAKAVEDVKQDMEAASPMDRLVCGDVGFGKTEVAIRAAFKAVCDSKQVAVLVPTTILAAQHYKTFKGRLENLPCRVEYINRFKSSKQIKEILKDLKEGKVDILIGTHRIAGKDVDFKDLGLLIIDEEQKFGVRTKEKIKKMAVNVDALTLTATPIPRTLQFSLMGARDLSVISTPPPNRQPVTTEIHTQSEEVIRDAISFELRRGGQAFFVHNRINDIEYWANTIIQLVPDAKVAYAHGQMEGARLEKIMMKFVEGEYDVLVSTNIIESGLDIPNANTIIINRAHNFGLSDLHQMRGRVGRSNRKAYCYLISPPVINLSADARKRLSTLEEFSDLGDGFKVAMRDLDIRGAGDILGAEQSGFISDLGFDMYNKILEDAIKELKENEFKELFQREMELPDAQHFHVDCTIETDFEILIPEEYVSNISERLNLYMQADALKDEAALRKFEKMLLDRFGPLPDPVHDLLEAVRLRWLAEGLGIEKLTLKNDSLKAYLLPQDQEAYYQSPVFGKILAFVKKNPVKSRIREAKKRIIFQFEEVSSISGAQKTLKMILD